LKTRTSTTVPVTPGGTRRLVSRTSEAFSPKMARSSFSSGVIGLSPLGVTLTTRMSIGAEVLPGDVLVGQVTPKGERPMAPEGKLLRAIFGEKASDVRDTSLRLPPGVAGTIVEVRVFNRHGVDKDERALAIERAEIERLGKDRDDEFAILNRNISGRLREIILGKKAVSGP